MSDSDFNSSLGFFDSRQEVGFAEFTTLIVETVISIPLLSFSQKKIYDILSKGGIASIIEHPNGAIQFNIRGIVVQLRNQILEGHLSSNAFETDFNQLQQIHAAFTQLPDLVQREKATVRIYWTSDVSYARTMKRQAHRFRESEINFLKPGQFGFRGRNCSLKRLRKGRSRICLAFDTDLQSLNQQEIRDLISELFEQSVLFLLTDQC